MKWYWIAAIVAGALVAGYLGYHFFVEMPKLKAEAAKNNSNNNGNSITDSPQAISDLSKVDTQPISKAA